MKLFNKIVALLLLAVSFSAGAVISLDDAKALLSKVNTEVENAKKQGIRLEVAELLEKETGINGGKFTWKSEGADIDKITADVVKEVIDANTGLLFQTKRILDNKLTKFVGSAFVLGGTIYAGNKYKTQLGDVTKKLVTKIVDGYNKVNGPKAVAFVKENALNFWNKLPNFKKQAVQAVKKVTVDQTTYNNYDGVMNSF